MTILTQSLELTLNTDLSRDDLRLEFYRGLPVNVRCLVRHGATVASLTGVQSVTLMVRTSREDTEVPALMSDTVDSAGFTACTLDQWAEGTHQHVTFGFTGAETNLVVTGKKRTLWLVAKAMLTDGRSVVLGTGQAVCHESNAIPAGEVPANADPAISVAAGDARYAALEHEHEIGDTNGLPEALAAKADTTTMNARLADKVDTTTLNTRLANKADTTAMNELLAAKAALSDVIDRLLLKADAQSTATAINAILATLQTKSNAATVTAALLLKADLVDGVIPTSQLPVIKLLESLGAAANETQMLALRGDFGSLCLRTDNGIFYAINGSGNGSLLSHWTALGGAAPSSGVQMINNQAGPIVVLGKADIGLANVTNVDATVRNNHTGTQAIGTVTGLQATLDSKASKVNGALPVSEMGGGGRARVSYLTISGHTDPGAAEVPEVFEQTASPAPVGYIYIAVGVQTFVDVVTYDTGPSGIRFTFDAVNPTDGTIWVDTASADLAVIRSMFQSALNDNSGGGGYTSFNDDNYIFTVTANGVGSTSMLTLGSQGFTVSGGGIGNDYIAPQAAIPAIPPNGGVLTASLAPGKQISIVAASCIYSDNIAVGCVFATGGDIVFGGGPSSVAMQRYPARLGQLYEDVVLAFASDPGYNPYLSITVEVHYLEF